MTILLRFRRRGSFFSIEVLIVAVGFITSFLSLASAHSSLSVSLRVPHPENTYFIGRGKDTVPDASPIDLLSWGARQDIFSNLGGFMVTPARIETQSLTIPVHVAWVTSGMVSFLPSQVDAGRQLSDADFRGGSNVLMTAAAVKELGLTSPVGAAIRLSGLPYQVVGVLPAWARFPYPTQPEVLVPFSPTSESAGTLAILGELRPGLALPQAERQLNQKFQVNNAVSFRPVRFVSLKASLDKGAIQVADYGLALAMLTLLVLIGTVSFIELLDVARRRKELAIKLALGATTKNLLFEKTIEILVVCSVGLLVSYFLLRACWPWFSGAWATQWTAIPRLDGFLLASLGSLFFISSLTIAFASSLVLFAIRPFAALKEEGSSVSRPVQRTRMTIVALQVAVCVAFALSAARLDRELTTLSTKPLGISVDGIWDGRLVVAGAMKMGAGQTRSALEVLRTRLQSLPGVEAAAFSSEFPAGDHAIETSRLTPRGQVPSWANTGYFVPVTFVDANYLQLVGSTLLGGRYFTGQDLFAKPGEEPPVILSEPLARKLFGDVNPVGKEIEYGGRQEDSAEVVGVVTGMRTFGLKAPTTAELFVPLSNPWPLSFTLKTRSSAPVSLRELQQAVSEVLPGTNVKDFYSLRERFDTELIIPRKRMGLLAFFAVVAGCIAPFGLASVLFALIKERDLEIGIRRALGAQDRDLALALLSPVLPWVLMGFLLGLIFPVLFPTPFGIDVALQFATTAWAEIPVIVALFGLITVSLWIPLRGAFRRPINQLLRAE